MPRNPYPARWPTGSRVGVREYPVKASATWLAGALLKLTSGELEEAAADPTAVIGIALHAMTSPAASDLAAQLAGGSKGLVYVADNVSVYNWPWSGSSPTPGTEYGVVKTSSVWYLDQAETTTKVLTCIGIDPLDSTRAFARFSTVTLQG